MAQKSASVYRLLMILNSGCWIFYDFFTEAYTTIITHSIGFVMAIVGILTIDMKKGKKKQ